MDLFETSQNTNPEASEAFSPLAEKLRPKSLTEFVGQAHLFRKDSPLSLYFEGKIRLPNMVLWGPPGTGKTTLAQLLAQRGDYFWISVNAIETGAKKLRELGTEAKYRKVSQGTPTLLFIDEIHRLNRSQQDVLLPFCEKGDFTLVGATTENPGYELNRALLSRCQILAFKGLDEQDLSLLMQKAASTSGFTLEDMLQPEAQQAVLRMVAGDGRKLLQIMERLIHRYRHQEKKSSVSVEQVYEELQNGIVAHDKASDLHYDCISAFIKSIRGSDPDAGLYYLARMIAGGEDPKFIARRLVILASEDVGNADPRALSLAVAGFEAVEKVGLPEAAINLAQVVTYLACAPKSNRSYLGLKKAQALVEQTGELEVPLALRSAQTAFAKSQGHGEGYLYTHDFPKGYARQSYLPEKIKEESFYEPLERGFEKTLKDYLEWMKKSLPAKE